MGSPFQLPQIQFPQPTIQENPVQPSGFGGKTQALSLFADKFLAGVSRGRALAFQRSQQQEERSLLGLRSAMQDIQQANIPDELKQQQLAPLQQMVARLVAGAGDDQGKQKGKKGGGQSDDAHAHPLQGFTQAIKGFAARMVGPGAEKQPVSPEDIHAAVGQAYASLKNTPTISTVNQKLDTTYSTVLSAQEQAAGHKFTASEQLKTPALASIASQSAQLNKGKPSQVIGGFLSAGEKREDEANKQADPLYQAQTKNLEAEARERDRNKPKVPEAEQPLGEKVPQLNKVLTDRWHVLNSGKPLPEEFTLPKNAVQKDYDRIEKALSSVENAAGTQANREQTREMREQSKSQAGTWIISENDDGEKVLFNSKTAETKAPPKGGINRPGTYDKTIAPIKGSQNYAQAYLKSGQFTGPGDEALLEKFFDLAKPASGFRMSKPQLDMLQRGASWKQRALATKGHIEGGTIFSDEQRKQIVDTMNQLASSKLKAHHNDAEPPGGGGGDVVDALVKAYGNGGKTSPQTSGEPPQ